MTNNSGLIDLLNLKLEIDSRFFKKTKFVNIEIEEIFLKEERESSKQQRLYSNLLVIGGYLAILFYIFLAFNKEVSKVAGCLCLGVSVILMAVSSFLKSNDLKILLDHIQVLLVSLFLNLKVIYIAVYLNTHENDNDGEIIRTVIYDFVSANLLALVKLDGRLAFNVVAYLMNCSAILVAQHCSNSNHHYYLDALSNICVSLMFYFFKKSWELKLRRLFAEQFKTDQLYTYTYDYINGLNGYHMNWVKGGAFIPGVKLNGLISTLYTETKRPAVEYSVCHNLIDDSSLVAGFVESMRKFGEKSMACYKLTDNLKELQCEEVPACLMFTLIGQYSVKTPKGGIKYFDVYYRKLNLANSNIIFNVMMYDITELILSKQALAEEVILKEKVFAKVAHEFKTPLNSIIGLIGNVDETIDTDIIATRKYLKTVKNLSNYVIFLISDIINYSNIKRAEEMKVNIEYVQLRDVTNFGFDIMNALINCNKAKSEAVKTEIEFEDEIDDLIIKADEIRLNQILLNFISNAVKFTKSGLIKIICKMVPNKQFVMLSISDTGIGLTEENRKKLFNDFTMIKSEFINNALGSGLGLSICKSLASRMNMKVFSMSTYGQGSEFSIAIPYKSTNILTQREGAGEEINLSIQNPNKYFLSAKTAKRDYRLIAELENIEYSNFDCSFQYHESFPQLQCNENILTIINRVDSTQYDSPQKFPKLKVSSDSVLDIFPYKGLDKILIIDDNHFISENIKTVLLKVLNENKKKMEIVTASDGVDMIKYVIEDQVKGNKIKCILTDENMEYINGSEAIKIIRNLEAHERIKHVDIISITSHEDNECKNYIMQQGAQYVLAKPLSMSDVVKVFRELNIL